MLYELLCEVVLPQSELVLEELPLMVPLLLLDPALSPLDELSLVLVLLERMLEVLPRDLVLLRAFQCLV